MRALLPIALGAALGAGTRYAIALWATARWGTLWPVGTLLVNVGGSFLLGVLMARAAVGELTPSLRLFAATGFCGSLTTFSTFSYESVALMQRGEWGAALTYLLASVLAGLLAVLLGLAVGRPLPGV